MPSPEEWTIMRRAEIRRLQAQARAIMRNPAGAAQLTSRAPGLAGTMGALLEEIHAARVVAAERFLAAQKHAWDGTTWSRVEALLADHPRLRLIDISPVMLLDTPDTVGDESVLARAHVRTSFKAEAPDDELAFTVLHPSGRFLEPPQVLHIGPPDLPLGVEQNWYCELRCNGTPADVASEIVRLALCD